MVTGKVRRFLLSEWEHNPNKFTVDEKTNKLILDFEDANTYEIQWKVNELPAKLCAEIYGRKLILKLDEARYFTGIQFKKKGFPWFRR